MHQYTHDQMLLCYQKNICNLKNLFWPQNNSDTQRSAIILSLTLAAVNLDPSRYLATGPPAER